MQDNKVYTLTYQEYKTDNEYIRNINNQGTLITYSWNSEWYNYVVNRNTYTLRYLKKNNI